MKELQKILDDVRVTWMDMHPMMDDRGDSRSAPFTKRLYIFTGTLRQDRAQVKSLFRSHGLEAIIVDDERWKFEWDAAPADVFICHDSRDKPRYARPVYEELVRRNLKVWLDEFSIKPGDDFVERIDQGLATSRHALLLLTKRFLQNDRWASQEMSALLNRQVQRKAQKSHHPFVHRGFDQRCSDAIATAGQSVPSKRKRSEISDSDEESCR
jgi:hypothetical protein